jgi:hypothetical protein
MPTPDPTLQADFRRYAEMIEGALRPPPVFIAEAESANTIQVERGLVYPQALVEPGKLAMTVVEPLIQAALSTQAAGLRVVDRHEHYRPVYRPLLIYSWTMAYRLAYETLPGDQFGRWEEALRLWADLLEARLEEISLPGHAASAAAGSAVAEACWIALTLHAAGMELARDAWKDLAADVFGRLPHWQQPNGQFLTANASDQPETLAYHELVILHAAASYAAQSQSRPLSAAVAAATVYHQQQTQPDHATSQPWGVFAFAWNRPTRPLADALLHAAAIQAAPLSATGGVGLMLLADALYCIKLFPLF